jgi:pimeloyl-ACP methyl ester carboxylesterase
MMTKTLFLPGASGSAAFWWPVAQYAELDGVFIAWPGLGKEPAHADVNSLDDLVMLAASYVTEPVNIVAQSMGGVVAIRLALMFPDLVRRLVLALTSGGVPVADLGGSDWRGDYFAAFPKAADWIATPVPDLSDALHCINAPTLLLWGDADPISPVAVGDRLASLIPKPSPEKCVNI